VEDVDVVAASRRKNMAKQGQRGRITIMGGLLLSPRRGIWGIRTMVGVLGGYLFRVSCFTFFFLHYTPDCQWLALSLWLVISYKLQATQNGPRGVGRSGVLLIRDFILSFRVLWHYTLWHWRWAWVLVLGSGFFSL